jgi:hypothetical protein
MASNINPNNIDGSYPVAGQDNDSQGFRDNFTNTKNNFRFASNEISDLQSKAVLKSALIGSSLNNDMGGSILSNAQLRAVSESLVSFGSQSGTLTLNYAAGSFYTVTTAGSISLAFSNFSAAGTTSRLRIQITVDSTTHTMTLPSEVSIGIANLAGFDDGVITFNRTGTFEYEFETSDNGATVTVFDLTSNQDPLYLPNSESIGSGDTVSLGVTSSYFVTSGASTATMAAGAPGQIKILAMRSYGGNMVVTVSNPAWNLGAPTGTITFDAQGDSCIMQYIDGRWFVVGNNGTTFA